MRILKDLILQDEVLLVLDNTKGLFKERIQQLNPNVTISITGGLNPQKQKFNTMYYQKRTYYTPAELSAIIGNFEIMERQINPLWDDLEKAMFIYTKLCEYLNYSECSYNGKDASRNLLGMITRKSVCSGISLICKEAMERNNIKCLYQNRQSKHSWNIIHVNGQVHGLELTWDVYQKIYNECKYYYFCRQNADEFYRDKHHNIDRESEEIRYPLKAVDVYKLAQIKNKIMASRIYKKEVQPNSSFPLIGKNIIVDKKGVLIDTSNIHSTYFRNDGSSFLLIPTGKSGNGVIEYIYAEYDVTSNQASVTNIYSETDFTTIDDETRRNIANILLSKERLVSKIRNFNHYVGFMLFRDKTKYYTPQIEKDLNIYR